MKSTTLMDQKNYTIFFHVEIIITMPRTCNVPRCMSNGKAGARQDVRFHRFPQDIHQRIVWANQMKKPNWLPKDNSRMCEV